MKSVIFGLVGALVIAAVTWLYWPILEPRLMPITLTVVGTTNRPSGFMQVTFRLHNGSRKTIVYAHAKIHYEDKNGHWDDDPPPSNAANGLKPGASDTFQFYVAPGAVKARGTVDCEWQTEMTKTWLFRRRFGIEVPLRERQIIYSPVVLRE